MKGLGKIAIGCMVVLAGCQQAEEVEIESEELPLSIEASIGDLQMSRYVSSDNPQTPNNLSFSADDEIGLFVNDRSVVKWTYKGNNSWDAVTSVFWPNKLENCYFYAYYPYVEATSKESVKMPSLAGQNGTIESLCLYDFLVASTGRKYSDANGVVSFTGNASFKHVSSLVAVTVDGNCDLKASKIKKISFAATNIASVTTYSFRTKETTIVDDEKNDKMESCNLDFQMTGEDKTFYFILNKGVNLSDVTFCIEYSTGENHYKAEKADLGSEALASGGRYNFNLKISDGVLTISGGTIQNWGNGTQMDDIEINNPTVDNNQTDENP